jgi:hypothetical protein
MRVRTTVLLLLDSALVVYSSKPKPPPVGIQDVARSISGVLHRTFMDVIDTYDPSNVYGLLYADKDSLEVNGNCTDFAKVSYRIDDLRGLQYFNIDSVKAVGRSDRVSETEESVSYDGFFEIKASFLLDLETDVSIVVESKGCCVIEESEGIAISKDTVATIILALQGSGPSLDGLSVDKLRFIDMDFTFSGLTSTVVFEHVTVDATGDLHELIDNTISKNIVPELIALVEGLHGSPKA